MALELDTIVIDMFSSDGNGDLVTSGHKVRYTVRESTNPDLRKSGELTMNAIVGTDSVTTWWGKVQQQVKDAEGIT